MTRMVCLTAIVASFATTAMAQTIPSELWGSWVVGHELPTSTISCWGEAEARTILGTEIEYSAVSFRWKDKITRNPTADVSVVTAKQFHDENSGQGANSSQVSFDQLGIQAATAKRVTINHPGATSELPGEPLEIPGDIVLLKDLNTIVFSVCNVYFEAKRVLALSPNDNGKDPHRPTCTGASCLRIKSFLKTHYCGKSPYGNGPNDGCLIRPPKKFGRGYSVTADFKCKWSEQKPQCDQHGQPPSEVRSVLIREMRKLGLPGEDEKQVYFAVWQSSSSGWSLAEGYHSSIVGDDMVLCQVILVVDRNSRVVVLRKVPFQKTDVDVPDVTTWSPVDVTDAEGKGQVDVILEADSYENHWIEVDRVQDGSSHTVFSGLGYFL
jgi:hypothetical protein